MSIYTVDLWCLQLCVSDICSYDHMWLGTAQIHMLTCSSRWSDRILCFNLDCMLETHTHTGTFTHSSCLTCSNPWVLQGGSQNKIPPADYFSCDQKIHMFSEREECSDAMATWRLLTSPSSVSPVLGCFVFCTFFFFFAWLWFSWTFSYLLCKLFLWK